MICGLSCDVASRGSGRLLGRVAAVLTVTYRYIWHGCGTNFSRRQSATTAGASAERARVCLAVPPTASAMLSGVVGRVFRDEGSGTRLRRPLDGHTPVQLTRARAPLSQRSVHIHSTAWLSLGLRSPGVPRRLGTPTMRMKL